MIHKPKIRQVRPVPFVAANGLLKSKKQLTSNDQNIELENEKGDNKIHTKAPPQLNKVDFKPEISMLLQNGYANEKDKNF